jgi:hypothetical protein
MLDSPGILGNKQQLPERVEEDGQTVFLEVIILCVVRYYYINGIVGA